MVVSVPERGFVALIRDRTAGRESARFRRGGVSVPERGFVALILSTVRCTKGGIVLIGFSPRAGIRGFDTQPTPLKSSGMPIGAGLMFQSPSGDSWL
jgi:hypothetical protein